MFRKKILRIALTSPILLRHKKKATFEEFHGYIHIKKTLAICLEKISRIALTNPILWRHKKKAAFEEFHGYLHRNMMRIVETFLIAIKLGIIT